MTNQTRRTWLLVALAVVALAVAAPAVAAHGNDSATDDAPSENGTDDWATWMDDHMGPGATEWMESHMGVTVDEMARDMADGEYDRHGGAHVDDDHPGWNGSDDIHGTAGEGHGC